MGRLETPPEFKVSESNTLSTPGISNGHQAVARGGGLQNTNVSLTFIPAYGPPRGKRLVLLLLVLLQ